MGIYSALSVGYDDFFDAEYLSKLKQKYLILLKKNGVKQGNILDAGCGTGMLSLFLHENGYNVTGADISEEMLIKARKKSLENNYGISWYNCDICNEFPFSGEFDAIVSSLDVVNHITDIEKLEAFFLNSFEALKDGGIFIFDINSYKKFTKQYADRKYVYSSHHSVCVWENNYNPETQLCDMYLEVFTKENGKYRKNTDSFTERFYKTETIKHLLKKVGFHNFSLKTIDKGTRHIISVKKL